MAMMGSGSAELKFTDYSPINAVLTLTDDTLLSTKISAACQRLFTKGSPEV
jgi:hypothetical protein